MLKNFFSDSMAGLRMLQRACNPDDMSGPDAPITVAELFAGVGGFRLGLEGNPESDEDTGFKVVFSNQWEPDEKAQWLQKFTKSDSVRRSHKRQHPYFTSN